MAKKYFDNLHFRDANETIYVQDSEAREEISNLNKQTDDLNNFKKITESNDTILIGDSYAVKSVVGNNTWQDVFEQCTGFKCYKYSQGSIGFIGITTNTFLTYLNKAINDITDKKSVKNVIVCGGANDINKDEASLLNAISKFVQTAKQNFVNAKIYVGCIGNFVNSYNKHEQIFVTKNIYKKCVKYGANYLSGVSFPMTDNSNYIPGDATHPNTNGCIEIGEAVAQSLKNGIYTANKYRKVVIKPSGIASSFSGGNEFIVRQFTNNYTACTQIIGAYNIGTGIHISLNAIRTVDGNDLYEIATIENALALGGLGAQNCCSMYVRLMQSSTPYPIDVYPCIVSLVDNKLYLKIINKASASEFSTPIKNVSRIDLLFNGVIVSTNF